MVVILVVMLVVIVLCLCKLHHVKREMQYVRQVETKRGFQLNTLSLNTEYTSVIISYYGTSIHIKAIVRTRGEVKEEASPHPPHVIELQ